MHIGSINCYYMCVLVYRKFPQMTITKPHKNTLLLNKTLAHLDQHENFCMLIIYEYEVKNTKRQDFGQPYIQDWQSGQKSKEHELVWVCVSTLTF